MSVAEIHHHEGERSRSGRRRFLASTLAGVLGSSLVSNSVTADDVWTKTPCGVVSVSDTILLYANLAYVAWGEAYKRKAKRDTEKLKDCIDAFRELYQKLEQLSTELANSEMTAATDQIRRLTDLSGTTMRLIEASSRFDRSIVHPFLASLLTIRQQVCRECETLLSQAEVRISGRAARLLKEMIELTTSPDFQRLYSGQTVATARIDPEPAIIDQLVLSDVRDNMFRARSAVIEAENPLLVANPSAKAADVRQKSYRQARENLVSALLALKDLISVKERETVLGVEAKAYLETSLPDTFWAALPGTLLAFPTSLSAFSERTNELKTADSLGLLLASLARVIENPDYQTGVIGAGSEGSLLEVSYKFDSERASPPYIDQQEISRLLWTYCPPGTQPQVDKCRAVLVGVRGLELAPSFLRWLLILAGLQAAERASQITCEGVRDLGALARALAKLM